MNTWKFTIKPQSERGYSAYEFCKENSYLGVGWSKAYEKPLSSPNNLKDAKKLVKNKYKKWPYQLKHLLESVKKGDHLWVHKKGKYYLCVAEEQILYGEKIDKNFINYDLGHVRKVKWIEVPEVFVTGKIQRGTIAQRMIQKIKMSEKENDYSKLLAKELSANKNWKPNIDEKYLKGKIEEVENFHLFSMMSPDDLEDIVAMYLQDKGWYLLKSTCFRSKPFFEFSMLNKKHEACYIQVKSGNSPNKLSPVDYKKHVEKNSVIYLFSTHKEAYEGDSVDGVIPIEHIELIDWLKKNLWALALPLKTRLSIY